MKKYKTIAEIMTTNVITIDFSDNLWEIEKTFKLNHLRHAPVCKEGEVVGMISQVDLRKNILDDRIEKDKNFERLFKAFSIMSPEPICLQQNQSLAEAAQIFIDNDFHALPVLHGYDLVGIISTTDVIKHLLEIAD